MTGPANNTRQVYTARGLGGRIVYDGTTVTLYRDSLTALVMSMLQLSNDYGTQALSAKAISSIEIVRQLGFMKKLVPIYFIRFVYPGSSIINTPSLRAAFAHNALLMSLFDNRDFFRLREAMLADAGDDEQPSNGQAPVTTAPAPTAPAARNVRSRGLIVARMIRGGLAGLSTRPVVAAASALMLAAGLGAVMFYATQPGYANLAKLGMDASRSTWSRSVDISWTGKDDAKYRTSISPAAADMLEAESRNFIAEAPGRAAELFRSEFAPRLDRITNEARSRIVDYGNWTFDWGTSYWLLVDGLSAAAGAGEDADQKTALARGEAVIRQKISARYKESLFPEDAFGSQLRSGVEKGVSAAANEIKHACQSINDLLEDVAKAPVQRLFEGHWVTDPTWTESDVAMPACTNALEGLHESEARLQDSARRVMTETHVPEIAIARLARPLMTVTIGMLGSATGVTLAAVRLGLPRALLVSPLVTAAGVKLAITATDLALTSLDEAVNRAPFEAEIAAGVSTAQAEVLRVSLQDVAETTAAALKVRPR